MQYYSNKNMNCVSEIKLPVCIPARLRIGLMRYLYKLGKNNIHIVCVQINNRQKILVNCII